MENRISKYISWNEATKSPTAIRLGLENVPNPEQLENMKRVATIFDFVREKLNTPLIVSSFFRSEQLNKSVKGAKKSDHVLGCAIDIDSTDNQFNRQIFEIILHNCEFDQLIYEFGDDTAPDWVHVSLKAENNRKQVLRAVKENGKTVYKVWQ